MTRTKPKAKPTTPDKRNAASIATLDQTFLHVLPGVSAAALRMLNRQRIYTLADARKHWPRIRDSGELPRGAFQTIAGRLHASLTCARCGALLILYSDGMLCERAGRCDALIVPYPSPEERRRLRRLFPDRISK